MTLSKVISLSRMGAASIYHHRVTVVYCNHHPYSVYRRPIIGPAAVVYVYVCIYYIDHLVNIQCKQYQKVYNCYIQLTLDLTLRDHTLLLGESSRLIHYSTQNLLRFSHWPRCYILNFRLTKHCNHHIISTCLRNEPYLGAENQ
jgi:hypothetical protein